MRRDTVSRKIARGHLTVHLRRSKSPSGSDRSYHGQAARRQIEPRHPPGAALRRQWHPANLFVLMPKPFLLSRQCHGRFYADGRRDDVSHCHPVASPSWRRGALEAGGRAPSSLLGRPAQHILHRELYINSFATSRCAPGHWPGLGRAQTWRAMAFSGCCSSSGTPKIS